VLVATAIATIATNRPRRSSTEGARQWVPITGRGKRTTRA
jgi:hypothetical protein